MYRNRINDTLASIKFEHELARCIDVHCYDPGHVNTVARLYNIVANPA